MWHPHGLTSSGKITTSTSAVWAMPGTLCEVDVSPPDSGIAVVTLYDNPSAASGTVLALLEIASGTTSANEWVGPVVANKGIYAAVTGVTTGVEVVVKFMAG